MKRQSPMMGILLPKFSTLTDDIIRRRLDTFNDLFVVARDAMEDLLDSKFDKNDDDDEDDDDELVQNVAFAKEAVNTAVNEFNNLLNDLNDNVEQKNRVLRSHGLKVKQLEGELAMILQGTNPDDDEKVVDEVEEDEDDDDDDDENNNRKK
jgi:hypothetical protein